MELNVNIFNQMKKSILMLLFSLFVASGVFAQMANNELADVNRDSEETLVYNDQLIKLKMVINPMWEFESAAVKIEMSKSNKFRRSAQPDRNGKYDIYLRFGEVYDFVISQAGCLDKKFTIDTRYKGYYDNMVKQIFEINLNEKMEEEQIEESYAFKLFKNQKGKLQLFFD